jgi:hypothetical protein
VIVAARWRNATTLDEKLDAGMATVDGPDLGELEAKPLLKFADGERGGSGHEELVFLATALGDSR